MNELITSKIDNNLLRIQNTINHFDGYPSFKKLFSTDLGIHLGYQADELFDFIRKISMITLSFNHAPSSKLLSIGLGEDLNDNLDLNWLRTLGAFSLYTYLDIYSRRVIDWIEKTPSVSEQLVKHLIEYTETRPDKSRPPTTKIKEMKRFSVENRLVQIEKGLLSGAIDEELIKNHRASWKSFIEFRNRSAHHDPRIEPSSEIMQLVDESLGKQEYDFSSVPPHLQEVTLETAKVVQKASAVIIKGILYPVYIDAGLDAWLNC